MIAFHEKLILKSHSANNNLNTSRVEQLSTICSKFYSNQ